MQNTRKGSVAALLLALLVLGIVAYSYFQRKAPEQEASLPIATVPTNDSPVPLIYNVYQNDKYGFSLDIPMEWAGYRVSERDMPASTSIDFGIKDQDAVFMILIFTKAQWQADLNSELRPYRYLAENDKYVFASAHVQDETEAVRPLSKFESAIISSFRLVGTSSSHAATPVASPDISQLPKEQGTIDFPGMKEYTDKDFGFSFWYPEIWALQESSGDGKLADVYAGGTISKTVTVSSQKYLNDGISIAEFSSDDKNIRDNSNCGPASGCASSIEYYFDTDTHTWMKESDFDYGPEYHEPPTFAAADISNNSMGGLHIFNGNARFGDDVIVPLSARHFLIIRNVSAGTNQIRSLAKTVLALDPAVAVPASSEDQIAAIRTEGFMYGGLGRKVGDYWYVYANQAYDSQGNLLPDAQASSFRTFSVYSDGSTAPGDFATDGTHVYSAYFIPARELPEADPSTFTQIKQQYEVPFAQSSGKFGQSFTSYDTTYQKDKSHVWDNGRLLPGADPSTFVVTGRDYSYQQNSDGSATLAHDAYHSYGENGQGYPTIDGVTIGD